MLLDIKQLLNIIITTTFIIRNTLIFDDTQKNFNLENLKNIKSDEINMIFKCLGLSNKSDTNIKESFCDLIKCLEDILNEPEMVFFTEKTKKFMDLLTQEISKKSQNNQINDKEEDNEK
ncbi:hypothetical protein DMUE_2876 [Dictyocoela muelleri]|nr:hypothetical protein DMUE_2876 [Dictyocoela muelleri]